MDLTPVGSRRLGRAALLLGAGAAAATLGACSAQASAGTSGSGSSGSGGQGTGSAAVRLSPAAGPTSGKPTWSTSAACPSGFRGSAIFREVHSDGTSTNSISSVAPAVNAPFSGTLQGTIAQIQAFGGIRNGGTQKLVVICFSGPSATGTQDRAMYLSITYSADGSRYATKN